MQEQNLSKDFQSSNIYNDGKFLLGKDLSEDVKEELTRYVTDLQGYSIIDGVLNFCFFINYYFLNNSQVVPKRRSSIKYFITDNPDDASIAKV